MANLSVGRFSTVVIILIVILIALIVWALYNRWELSIISVKPGGPNENPLCMPVLCPSGFVETEVAISSTSGVSSSYETVNYCTTNAPPTSLIIALQQCAGTYAGGTCTTYPGSSASGSGSTGSTGSNVTNDEIVSWAKFLNESYIDTCGFGWKDVPQLGVTQSSTALPTPTELIALTKCAANRGLSQDPNIVALKTKCGAPCT